MAPQQAFANSCADAQELTMNELESVSGGVIPLLIIGARIIVTATGCGLPKHSPPTPPRPGGPMPGDPTYLHGLDQPSR